MSEWLVGRDGRYLGDGVYASVEPPHIWLQTLEGHRIALEPEVFDALVGYERDMRAKAKREVG